MVADDWMGATDGCPEPQAANQKAASAERVNAAIRGRWKARAIIATHNIYSLQALVIHVFVSLLLAERACTFLH